MLIAIKTEHFQKEPEAPPPPQEAESQPEVKPPLFSKESSVLSSRKVM